MQELHLLFIFSFTFFGLVTILSNNPVFSVLFLVLSFCNAACILILFQVELLSILFVIIYVGAIAVLFLFVVMMLEAKAYPEGILSRVFFLPLVNFFAFALFFEVRKPLSEIFVITQSEAIFTYDVLNFDCLDGISIYGQIFYNNFLLCCLLAGIVLLVAMIGAILLTFNFKKRNSEFSLKQLIKSDYVSVFS